MQNEMHFVSVDNITIVSADEILFHISIERHRHLTDPAVVKRSMNALMAKYPTVREWEGYAVNGTLYIKVTGDFDHDVAHAFIARYR